MIKLKKITEAGKAYVDPNKQKAWELFCKTLYEKNQMRQIAIEIIEDSVKTMKLLEEDWDLNAIVKEVGRSWQGGISFYLLTHIIEKFSKNSKRFVEAYNEMQQSKGKCIQFDDVMKKIK